VIKAFNTISINSYWLPLKQQLFSGANNIPAIVYLSLQLSVGIFIIYINHSSNWQMQYHSMQERLLFLYSGLHLCGNSSDTNW
jgi:hypothetical protein